MSEPKKELTEREKALESFKKDYAKLVEKYGWDVGATLQVVAENGIVQPRPQFVDIGSIKKEDK